MDDLEYIERFLEGEMEASEKLAFEERLKLDSALAQEVQEYKSLFESLNQFQERKTLLSELNQIHEQLEGERQKQIRPKTKSKVFKLSNRRTLALAASVALIAVVSTVLVMRELQKASGGSDTSYQALERQLEERDESPTIAMEENTQADEMIMDFESDEKQENKKSTLTTTAATAFVVSANGYLITSYHVVKNAEKIIIEAQRDSLVRLPVKTVYKDIKKDIAILQVSDTNFVSFGQLNYALRSNEAELGEEVFTLAYPRQDIVYAEGAISALTGYREDTLTYQISVPVNPGNSGGPLLDQFGNLVGIVQGKNNRLEGTAFALKSEYIQAALDSVSTQNNVLPLVIPQYNGIRWYSRPEQIKALKEFVFLLRVYHSKE